MEATANLIEIHGHALILCDNIKGPVLKVHRLTPKGKKPYKQVEAFYFPNEERRQLRLKYWTDKLNTEAEAKESKKAATKQRQLEFNIHDHFKVGDIVLNTWGWEQTNVDFYQVTEIRGNSKIVCKELKQIHSSSGGSHMSCNAMPEIDSFVEGGKDYTLTVKAWDYLDSKFRICNPESYHYFHKWDGTPKYKSWYA